MTKLLTALVLLASLGAGLAQVPDPQPAPVPAAVTYQPQYFLSAGVGFNHYAVPQASGFMTFGVKLADVNYTYTTLTMTSVGSTLSQGLMRILLQQEGFTLMLLGDAGVAAGQGNVGGAFAGGGALAYDISKWAKTPHTFAIATVKILKTSLNEVQPVFLFGVSKGF